LSYAIQFFPDAFNRAGQTFDFNFSFLFDASRLGGTLFFDFFDKNSVGREVLDSLVTRNLFAPPLSKFKLNVREYF
jgi:hypothetical protein